jgi:hypothetical protein
MVGASLPFFYFGWVEVGGGEQGEEGEEDEQGLEDGEAGKYVAEGADGEEQDGYRRGERGGMAGTGMKGRAAADEEVGDEQDEREDGDGESARGGEADSGEVEDESFEEGPDGQRGGGIEVSGNIPVAELEVSNGGVTVPSFVGVLGPIHPGGVVGEVGFEVKGVQIQKDGGSAEEQDVDRAAKREAKTRRWEIGGHRAVFLLLRIGRMVEVPFLRGNDGAEMVASIYTHKNRSSSQGVKM